MKSVFYLAAILSLTLAAASCSKGDKIALVTTTAEKGEISETVTATGTLESVTTVDVGTQVTGIIDKIYVDYNSRVQEGELIAEIEKVLLESELKSAEASMESAKLTFEYNQTNYLRDKALHDKQLISDYEFDTSQKEYEVSKQEYEKSQADIVKAKKNLNYAEIYSPIDGIVISRDVEVGQTVVSSMTVANLFTIADLSNMRVVADVDEADIGQVKVGQNVVFTVDAYPDDKFEGVVTQVRLNPTTENNVVTYEVLVSASNEEMKLIPGLTANLTIYVTHVPEVHVLPIMATRFTPHESPVANNLPSIPVGTDLTPLPSDSQKKRVWVIRDNQYLPVEVETGSSNGANIAITSGLNQGDVVAVEYSAASVEAEAESSSSDESSPFAPKPPSRSNNKK